MDGGEWMRRAAARSGGYIDEQTCDSALVADVTSNNYRSRSPIETIMSPVDYTRATFRRGVRNDRHAAVRINYPRNPQLIAGTHRRTVPINTHARRMYCSCKFAFDFCAMSQLRPRFPRIVFEMSADQSACHFEG